jgi:hypothetical protein
MKKDGKGPKGIERRSGHERRLWERRRQDIPVDHDRRDGRDRRGGAERRQPQP